MEEKQILLLRSLVFLWIYSYWLAERKFNRMRRKQQNRNRTKQKKEWSLLNMQMKLDFYEYFSWEFPWLFRNQESVFVKNRDFSVSTFRNELVFYSLNSKENGRENRRIWKRDPIQLHLSQKSNRTNKTKKIIKKSSRINKNWFLKT